MKKKEKNITPAENNQEKKPKLTKKKIILIITLLIILITISILTIMLINKNQTKLPKNIEYDSEKLGSPYMHCYNDLGKSIENVKENDTLNCTIGFELSNEEKYIMEELYFTLDYSKNLEYQGNKNGDNQVQNYKNSYKITIKEPNNYQSEIILIKFKVKKLSEKDDIYIKLNNIVYKNKNNTYFKASNITKYLVGNTNINYIYVEDNQVTVLKYNDQNKTSSLKGTYKCQSKDCTYLETSDNYIFFNDENLIIYDYENDKTTKLDKEYLKYKDYEAIKDENNNLIGIIFNNDEDMFGYYSITQNKQTLKLEYDYIYKYDELDILELTKDDKFGIYDLQKNKITIEPKYDYIQTYDLLNKYLIVSNETSENLYNIETGKLLFKENEYTEIKCTSCAKIDEMFCKLKNKDKTLLYAPSTRYINSNLQNKEYENVVIKQNSCSFAFALKDKESAKIYYLFDTFNKGKEYEDVYDLIYDTEYINYILAKEDNKIVLKSMNGDITTDILTIEENYTVDYDDTYITYKDDNEQEIYIYTKQVGKNKSIILRSFTYKLKTKSLTEN